MKSFFTANPDRYERMQYRRIGTAGVALPALSLGLWHNFGMGKDFATQRDIVTAAFDMGITHMDLANNYGPPPGEAERTFGRILASDLAHHRDELIISTKAGYRMWPGPYGDGGSRKYLTASLDQSLERLGLEYVDIFYSHRPDLTTPLEETMGALATAVHAGKALYVGISNYSPRATVKAAAILADYGVPLAIHQERYSMLDRHVETGAQAEPSLLDTVSDLDIGLAVFSPLAQGLLTDRYSRGVPPDSRAATGVFLKPEDINEDYRARATQLAAIAQEHGCTLAQLALAWVLRDERVTTALVGASSRAQLESSVAALDISPLNDAELARIEAILEESAESHS